MAEEIHGQRVACINSPGITHISYPQLGHKWVPRFITCHEGLKSAVGHRVESKRMDGATKEALNKWFDVFQSVKTERNTKHNLVNKNGCQFWSVFVPTEHI